MPISLSDDGSGNTVVHYEVSDISNAYPSVLRLYAQAYSSNKLSSAFFRSEQTWIDTVTNRIRQRTVIESEVNFDRNQDTALGSQIAQVSVSQQGETDLDQPKGKKQSDDGLLKSKQMLEFVEDMASSGAKIDDDELKLKYRVLNKWLSERQ
jgi:hypothetical protein